MNDPSDPLSAGNADTPNRSEAAPPAADAGLGASMPPRDEPADAIELIACWRCHKWVADSAQHCPYCEARLKIEPPLVRRVAADQPENPYCSATLVIDERSGAGKSEAARRTAAVSRLIWFFLALLVVGVAEGMIGHAIADGAVRPTDEKQSQLLLVVIAEAADCLLIVAALVMVPGPPRLLRSHRERLVGWIAAIPILAAVLGLNFAYHGLLRGYLHLPHPLQQPEFGTGGTWLAIAVICLQPALFEELFFRYLALGTLRRVSGVHAAVWISALMFGMAHIGVPLSIPILIVVGLGLGYARVWSGSMLLPMLMHFVHNAAVMHLNGLL